MKKCQTCESLVKNSYSQCFKCNTKQPTQKDDLDSQGFCASREYSVGSTTSEDTQYKKENIPRTVKNALWINYFGNQREGKCLCCKRESISINNFHAGHIQAEALGGKTSLDNLIPLCPLCNCSCGKMNVFDFIAKYNLTFGLKSEL